MPAQSGNNLSISQIRDGLINPNFTTPLYVSANSFTVAGDVTSWLRPGRGLVISFQNSGIKRCVATSLSYDSGSNKTTINTVGDSLVNETITSVLLSLSDLEGSLIIHNRIDPNLVLYLPFEEGTGTKTKDLSGWGNHGTLHGPTWWVDGKIGKALNFDGVDDYVECGNNSLGGSISVEVWVKPQDISIGWAAFVNKQVVGSTKKVFWIGQHETDGYVRFGVYLDGINETSLDTDSAVITNGEWYHIVGTYDGHYQKIYVNGSLKKTSNDLNSLIPSGNDPYWIGKSTTTTAFFKGIIDEVRIYNRALEANEVMAHYLRS